MEAPQMVKKVQQLTWWLTSLNHFVSRATIKCLPFFKILRKASKFEWTFEYE